MKIHAEFYQCQIKYIFIFLLFKLKRNFTFFLRKESHELFCYETNVAASTKNVRIAFKVRPLYELQEVHQLMFCSGNFIMKTFRPNYFITLKKDEMHSGASSQRIVGNTIHQLIFWFKILKNINSQKKFCPIIKLMYFPTIL